MSRKVYANVGTFSKNRPIPVLEPGVKTGNGKATFKTATAAANAARDARDEAREARDQAEIYRNCSESFMLKAADHMNEAKSSKESVHRLMKRDLVWKVLILGSVLIEILVRLTT